MSLILGNTVEGKGYVNDTGYKVDGDQPLNIIKSFRKKDLKKQKQKASDSCCQGHQAWLPKFIPGDHMVKGEDFQKVLPECIPTRTQWMQVAYLIKNVTLT